MSEFLSWLIAGVLPGLCVSAAAWAASGFYTRLSSRRRWRLETPSEVSICLSVSPPVDTGAYLRPATGIGQAKALAIIAPSLVRAWRSIDIQNIFFSDDLPGHNYEADLILIGGPKTNAVTARALEELGMSLGVTQKDSQIITDKQIFEGHTSSKSSESNIVQTDYGLIVRAQNPFRKSRRLIILSGSHTYGTVGAARFIVENKSMMQNANEVAVIVETRVERGHALRPQLVWSSRGS